jgi:hypothetical protein
MSIYLTTTARAQQYIYLLENATTRRESAENKEVRCIIGIVLFGSNIPIPSTHSYQQLGQCILFSVVFTPLPTSHHYHGSVWVISLITV